MVRGYGLYAPTKREALAVCRAQLGQGPVVQPAVRDWQTVCQDRGDDHPERCPVCGRRLVCLGVSLPGFHRHAPSRGRWWRDPEPRRLLSPWRREASVLTPGQPSAGDPAGQRRGPELTLSSPPTPTVGCPQLWSKGPFEGAATRIKPIGRKCPTRCAGRPTTR